MDQEMSKELVITESKAIRKSSKPTLIQIGRRWLCSTGKFHPNLVADYIQSKPRKKPIKVGELARTFLGAQSIHNKKYVRTQLHHAFWCLLQRGDFLVYFTGKKGRIEEVKLFDMTSEMERQLVLPQLDRMKKRHKLSGEKYDCALRVLALHQELVEDK